MYLRLPSGNGRVGSEEVQEHFLFKSAKHISFRFTRERAPVVRIKALYDITSNFKSVKWYAWQLGTEYLKRDRKGIDWCAYI